MFITFFLLSLAAVLYEVFRKKLVAFDFLSIFTFFFFLAYLLPAVFWSLDPTGSNWATYYFGPEMGLSWLVFFVLATAYISVSLGYGLSRKLAIVRNYSLFIGAPSTGRRLVFFYALVVSLVFLLIVVYSGGYAGFIRSGIASRYGEADLGLAGYLRYFLTFSELLFVLLLGLSIQRPSVSSFLLAGLILFIAISIAISTGGRAALVYVALIPLFFVIVLRRHVFRLGPLLLVGVILFFAPLVVQSGNEFLREVRSGIWGYELLYIVLGPIINEGIEGYFSSWGAVFSYYKHYLISIGVFFESPSVYEVPRVGLDYVRAIVAITPGVSGPAGHVDVGWLSSVPSEINRKALGGLGYVPPGWVAFALMNGGVGWLMLHGFLAGVIGGAVNSWVFDTHDRMMPVRVAIGMVFMFAWYRVFFAQDPWEVVLGSLGVLVLSVFVILGFSLRLRGKRFREC